MEHVDVLVIGAGISGIGAGYHLQDRAPDHSFLIFEGRPDLGGTWDLFKYPGVRSDSDMHTLGFEFKPWTAEKAIADGPSILAYLRETVQEYDLARRIRFNHHITGANWRSEESRWHISGQRTDTGDDIEITASYLYMCAGYYSYKEGYVPDFLGRDRFSGAIIHPQQWPEGLNYAGKRVIVIGSGATAVTIVPAIASASAHTTMLQRSPTYMAVGPSVDQTALRLRRFLPDRLAYRLTRWKNIQRSALIYRRSRSHPAKVKKLLLDAVTEALPEGYDVDTHFTPTYKPWDQRLCLVPDNDFFDAINQGKASVVTDEIASFTETGIELKSGEHLDADIIITATGLLMVALGEMDFSMDGTPVDFSARWTYKGMAYSDLPNLASCFGYINASWTLRADLTSKWVVRVLNHMRATATSVVTPQLRASDTDMAQRPWVDCFSSGYMQRTMHEFPRQGDQDPWLNTQDYLAEKKLIGNAKLEDGVLTFSNVAKPTTFSSNKSGPS
ncbi:MAG: NAD(P)/FAD-dependent oxidoreductase [Acidimicrobiales bacterium]|nr:NAD(P)/FAD-dependent oxidoreductase [Acidimicrobiales bacterium]